MATNIRGLTPFQWSLRPAGTYAGFETATSDNFTRARAAADRIRVAKANANTARRERDSAIEARKRGAAIQASAQAGAAGIRAGQAATQSSRLLVEFEARNAQKAALRQNITDTNVGRAEAGFAASGIQSIAASQQAQRIGNLQGNIEASQGNTQREEILGRARSAITNAFASGVGAAGSQGAANQVGDVFGRQVSTDTGVDIRTTFLR